MQLARSELTMEGTAADFLHHRKWWLYTSNTASDECEFTILTRELSKRPINGGTSQYIPFVLPALQNIYNAISAAGLAGGIKVTTQIDTTVLDKSYPPEDGVFRSDVAPYLNPVIWFLANTDAPIFAIIYPYFAYDQNPQKIDLRYALLHPFEGIVTPNGVRYQNLFYALLDAVYAALEKSMALTSVDAATDAGIGSIEVQGGESGWSSGG
ncbi:hypothetical protein ACS0TY_028248 [Phlomoides rotata]